MNEDQTSKKESGPENSARQSIIDFISSLEAATTRNIDPTVRSILEAGATPPLSRTPITNIISGLVS